MAEADEEATWRGEVVAFLAAHARLRTGIDDWSTSPIHETPDAEAAYFARCRAWQQTVFDGGFAGITWPRRVRRTGRPALAAGGVPGGGGPLRREQRVHRVDDRARGRGADDARRADEQQARHLRPLLRADEVWCQLFSEPDAGSDLANLGTRAVADGDEFVVDGQKVWTSGAHHADFGLLLARTDPDAPKHRGITFFLLDMRTAGVEVRPLRQMTGAAHFNEVFLHAVRVPAANVVGEVDHGWAVARTVLAAESSMIGNSLRFDVVGALTRGDARAGLASDPVLRQEFARVVTRERVLGAAAGTAAGRRPARRPTVGRRFGPQAAVVPGLDRARRARCPPLRRGRDARAPTRTPRTGARSCSPGSAARSAAAPTRSTATTSPNASSVSHPNPASTATSPGVNPARSATSDVGDGHPRLGTWTHLTPRSKPEDIS